MNPVKTYRVTRETGWNYRHLEVQHNEQSFLWVNNVKTGFWSGRNRIHLQTQSANGPVVAAAALRGSRTSCRVFLGNPDASSKDDWIDVQSGSWTNKQYIFTLNGRSFIWRRTHDKALGANSTRNTHFRLLDAQDESQILAVYIQDRKWFNSSEVARLEYFANLDPNLELLSMAAIFAIEEGIRKRKNNNAAAAGAASSA